MTKKIKIFTHNDLDGVGCAIVANIYFQIENVNYEICSIHEINSKIEVFLNSEEAKIFDEIFITDLSVNEEIAEQIENSCMNIKLFDHHKTALWLNKYDWATVIVVQDGIKESGTSLIYNYLYGEKAYNGNQLGIIVEAIRKYDTWDFDVNDPKSFPKKLNDIFRIIKEKDFINHYSWDYLKKYESYRDIFPSIFNEILKYKRIDIDEYINNKMKNIKIKFDKNNNKYVVVLCDRKDCLSELGNKIVNSSNVDYAMLVYEGGIGLRSIEEFDVSEIAKLYGGGGHKNASGFKCENYWEWLK